MDHISILPEKKRRRDIITGVTLVLLILSLLWLFYDLRACLAMRAKTAAIGSLDNGLGTGFIIRILFYISFATMLFRALAGGLKAGTIVIISITAGVVSVISVVFDWAALVDIYHDFPYGNNCTLEWTWLFSSLALRLVFYIAALVLIFEIMKSGRSATPSARPAVDEVVFEITQYIGIVSGFTGLIFTAYANIALRSRDLRDWLVRLILFYSLIIILPYFSMILYWLVRLVRKTEMTLYDEKQKRDIALSGLNAWLVSIPLMAVVFIFNYGRAEIATGFLWLPYYLFSTLFVFSVSLLEKFRKG